MRWHIIILVQLTNIANHCIVKYLLYTYHFMPVQPHVLLNVCWLLIIGIYEILDDDYYPIGIHIFCSRKFSIYKYIIYI